MEITKVYFIGFMGSGKSTLGRRLVRNTSWRFIDMDDYFEEKHQMTISRFFEVHGEDQFRIAEKEILQELASEEKVIIGTGGGAPCFFDNMQKMNDSGLTVYLKLTPEGLVDRLKTGRNERPLVANKSGEELLQFIKEKLDERTKYYEQANVIVDSEALPMDAYGTLLELSGVDLK